MQVDIIGGGLSGLATALSLKKHDKDIDVIVHEKHKQIGFNIDARRCGEAHHVEQQWKHWTPEKDSICSEIRTGITVIGKKTITVTIQPSSAWILDRPMFLNQMAKRARQLKIEIKTSEKIKDISQLQGDFIVDASGMPSIIKRQMGIQSIFVGNSYQQTLSKCNAFEEGVVKIVFDKRIGYFWVFPRRIQRKEVNVGIGFYRMNKDNLRLILEEFKQDHNITGSIDHVTGGLIPFGLQHPLRYKNILFVGDAGVGTFPFNGQGIYRALLSGDIAGRCIALGKPSLYTVQIYHDFLKWDLIGKGFLLYNRSLYNLNRSLVLPSWRAFYGFYNCIHTKRIH